MPQLSITPLVFPQSGAGVGQALVSAAEGGEVLAVDQELDFWGVLANQLKGVATLLEKNEEERLSLAAEKEGVEPVVNAGAATLPVDFSVLATSVFVPAPPVQAGAGSYIPAEADAENPSMYRNDSEVAEERSGVPVEAGAELLLMYRNGGEVSAKRSGIPAEAGVELSLMYRNGGEVSAKRSGIPDEVSVELSLMYRNGGEVPVGKSDIPAEADVENPLKYRNGREAMAGRSIIPAEGGVEKPLMQLSRTVEAPYAAEIAANGRSLPQAVLSEQLFADKSAVLVKITADNADGEIRPVDLSAALNATAVSPSSATAVFRNSEPLPALPVAPRVGSTEWGGAVGEKVVWMANQSHQMAELHLNPPNLGPLEVRLTISNEQVSALFVSHHAAVREAIETAMPRLREMLADNGIMLGNVTVGSESFSQQQASEERNAKWGSRSGLVAENTMAPIATPVLPAGLVRNGMVDIFA